MISEVAGSTPVQCAQTLTHYCIIRRDLPLGDFAAQFLLGNQICQQAVWSPLVRAVAEPPNAGVAVQAEHTIAVGATLCLKPQVNAGHAAFALLDVRTVFAATTVDVVNGQKLVNGFPAAFAAWFTTAVMAEHSQFRFDVARLVLLLLALSTPRFKNRFRLSSSGENGEMVGIFRQQRRAFRASPFAVSPISAVISSSPGSPCRCQLWLNAVLQVVVVLPAKQVLDRISAHAERISDLLPSHATEQQIRGRESLFIGQPSTSAHGNKASYAS